ncbi:MAG: polysaccharide deacetylase family protein [Rhodoferax sp.]|nr:polysaccharide deacetylase family protein [Rhodoferax sp.]
MDHTVYDYSALPRRPRGATPGALRAFAVLFLEHWEACPPPDAVRDPRMVGEFGSFTPDYRNWSQREYGLRVGLFRVLDALRDAGIRPVVAANAMAVQRLPALVRTLQEAGCEWLAHGMAATRMMHSGMTLAEQEQHITQCVDTLARATGVQPQGWLSQDWGTTPDTHTLLARCGIRYTLDWCNDDQPYWQHAEPPLLAIPLSAEWDDVQCQWLRHIEPRDHAALAASAFERLRAECRDGRRDAVFGLSIHPWLSGMPSRIRALRSLLAALRAADDVSWTTPHAIFTTHTATGDTPDGLS